jgi:hypothetical protein
MTTMPQYTKVGAGYRIRIKISDTANGFQSKLAAFSNVSNLNPLVYLRYLSTAQL